MFKLVAIDLDGTLLNNQRTLSLGNIQAIKLAARRGIKIVIATARDPLFVRAICRQLEINDPMICTNGAQVWGSLNGPEWAHYTIPKYIAHAVAKLADERNWYLSTTVGPTIYWRQVGDQVMGKMGSNRIIVKSNVDAVVGEPVRMVAHEANAIHGIQNLCDGHYAALVRKEVFYNPDGSLHSLALFSPDADKGRALQLVCQKLGIDLQDTLAIGDNMNDLTLLNTAGAFVAMGNAVTVLQRKANAIAPDNNHDGVAWALQKYVLK